MNRIVFLIICYNTWPHMFQNMILIDSISIIGENQEAEFSS